VPPGLQAVGQRGQHLLSQRSRTTGITGGIALCQVAVALTHVIGRGHTLIGRALYLPGGRAALVRSGDPLAVLAPLDHGLPARLQLPRRRCPPTGPARRQLRLTHRAAAAVKMQAAESVGLAAPRPAFISSAKPPRWNVFRQRSLMWRGMLLRYHSLAVQACTGQATRDGRWGRSLRSMFESPRIPESA
jgi:hypothetical protein